MELNVTLGNEGEAERQAFAELDSPTNEIVSSMQGGDH
jgi:hypothetical protein